MTLTAFEIEFFRKTNIFFKKISIISIFDYDLYILINHLYKLIMIK